MWIKIRIIIPIDYPTYHKYHGYYKSCGNIDSFRSDILHLYLDRVPQLNKAELKESYELEA